ncbi:hypothetical protein PUN4_90010 [Paraburkholderia unamae]|nr:hypothetical protein PUN4_90010 [Paraburkholderia unamae]
MAGSRSRSRSASSCARSPMSRRTSVPRGARSATVSELCLGCVSPGARVLLTPSLRRGLRRVTLNASV